MSALRRVPLSRAIVIGVLGFGALATGCSKKPKWYDAKVHLNRVASIRFDVAGKPTDVDVEFSYVDCPGEQIEIIRGDAAFAECMAKYKPGDAVKVKIEYHFLAEGIWDWDVHEMGGCKRPPDPDDQSSFDTVQECESIVVNGVNEGFKCSRIPQKKLLKACPWFGRH